MRNWKKVNLKSKEKKFRELEKIKNIYRYIKNKTNKLDFISKNLTEYKKVYVCVKEKEGESPS